jgi:hypothetical protein
MPVADFDTSDESRCQVSAQRYCRRSVRQRYAQHKQLLHKGKIAFPVIFPSARLTGMPNAIEMASFNSSIRQRGSP